MAEWLQDFLPVWAGVLPPDYLGKEAPFLISESGGAKPKDRTSRSRLRSANTFTLGSLALLWRMALLW